MMFLRALKTPWEEGCSGRWGGSSPARGRVAGAATSASVVCGALAMWEARRRRLRAERRLAWWLVSVGCSGKASVLAGSIEMAVTSAASSLVARTY